MQRSSLVFVHHGALYITSTLTFISLQPCHIRLSHPLPFSSSYDSPCVCRHCDHLSVPTLSSRYGYEACSATADWLLNHAPVRPLVGIVCGSGLGGLADMLKDQKVFSYSDIPNFPKSTGEIIEIHSINMSSHLI